MRYAVDIDYGQGGDTTVEADSPKDAMAEAIGWARDGDWPDDGCTVRVRVWPEDDPDSVEHRVITIEAQAPECVDADSHEWEPVGGCSENPGVFDMGGAIMTLSRCIRCGLERRAQASYCGRDEANYTAYTAQRGPAGGGR